MVVYNYTARQLCLCVSLLIYFGILITSCSSKEANNDTPEKFPVIQPIIKDTVLISEYVADIQSILNTEIRAKAGGYLESIHVDEGQLVTKSQLLFTISGQQYEQELSKALALLASATADTKAAEVEVNNTHALVKRNIVSQTELDLAQAKLEALRAKIDEAKAYVASASYQLSFAQVRAPFTGYINRIPNKVGSLITEGTLLTTISNNDEMYAYFNFSEREYLDYVTSAFEPGKGEVSLLLANNKLYESKGIIETVDSEIDRQTGSLAFRARFPNPKHLLKHGSSGKILVSTALKNAMLIPQKSTFEIQENVYVYKLEADNKILMAKIEPSVRIPHFFVITAGLSEKDQFIFEGIQRVKPGQQITAERVLLSQLNFND